MFWSLRELEGYRIGARDGDIGSVRDFYFDDERWAIRYLVVDTGGWLAGRHALISTVAVLSPRPAQDRLYVSLTREQVQKAPAFDTARPVSRQQEAEYFRYYGWTPYWSGAGLWGPAATPYALAGYAGAPAAAAPIYERPDAERATITPEERHLRSTVEVTGYGIRARDGDVGRVEDFVADDQDWSIAGIVVDTTKWWPGGEVTIGPGHVEKVDWLHGQVYLDMDRQAVKQSHPGGAGNQPLEGPPQVG